LKKPSSNCRRLQAQDKGRKEVNKDTLNAQKRDLKKTNVRKVAEILEA
jgi:hypothetical protein